MHTQSDKCQPPFLFYSVLTALLTLVSVTGWSQTQQEAVDAATNPAGQVPDEIPGDTQSITEGQTLFSQHCNVCHEVGKQVIGPALASVHNRRPIDWLVEFIQNSQHVIIDEEDEYAQHLYEQYNQQVMPNFEFLSRGEILNILAYIKAESSATTSGVSSVSETQADVAGDAPDGAMTDSARQEGANTTIYILVGAVLVLLLIVIALAVRGRSKTKA